METIDQFLKTRYHKNIPSLFAAVYERDVVAVKDILLTMLEEIIKKYPERPTEDNKEAKKDWSTLELLVIFFDIEYEMWLRQHHYPFESVNPLETNDYLNALFQKEDAQFIDDIIFSMMHYLAGYKTSKEQKYFIDALEKYKKDKMPLAK